MKERLMKYDFSHFKNLLVVYDLGAPGILEGEAKTLKKSGKMIEILYTEQ
jgi:hypothetical protein